MARELEPRLGGDPARPDGLGAPGGDSGRGVVVVDFLLSVCAVRVGGRHARAQRVNAPDAVSDGATLHSSGRNAATL